MQSCHDSADDSYSMEQDLRRYAKAHGLTVPGDIPSVAERIAGIVSGPSVLTEDERKHAEMNGEADGFIYRMKNVYQVRP